MNQSSIINKIKSKYGYRTDTQVAKLLGVSKKTISNSKIQNKVLNINSLNENAKYLYLVELLNEQERKDKK